MGLSSQTGSCFRRFSSISSGVEVLAQALHPAEPTVEPNSEVPVPSSVVSASDIAGALRVTSLAVLNRPKNRPKRHEHRHKRPPESGEGAPGQSPEVMRSIRLGGWGRVGSNHPTHAYPACVGHPWTDPESIVGGRGPQGPNPLRGVRSSKHLRFSAPRPPGKPPAGMGAEGEWVKATTATSPATPQLHQSRRSPILDTIT
jgi:hypothetical protein